MRIGIVADIHDAVSHLERALAALRAHDVDQIVTLGDAFETYLPREPAAEVDPTVVRFASRLKPHVVVAGCRFSHIEPWMDPHSLTDLWLLDGLPNTSICPRRSGTSCR